MYSSSDTKHLTNKDIGDFTLYSIGSLFSHPLLADIQGPNFRQNQTVQIWYSTAIRKIISLATLEQENSMFLFMGLCLGLSAFGLLGGAVWAYLKQQRTMQGRVAVTGTVVELTQKSTTSAYGYIICPVVEFTLPSGEKIKFASEFGSFPASNKVGEAVKVRYDSTDPQKAEIDSGLSLWLTPLILVFMGSIACCLTVAFLVFYWMGFSPS
jgi:hypothetical protein